MNWSCPICKDTNPLCLLVTCEERKKMRDRGSRVQWKETRGWTRDGHGGRHSRKPQTDV